MLINGLDRNVSPSSSKTASQPMETHREPNSRRVMAGSNPYFRNRSTTQYYPGYRRPTNDSSHQVALKKAAGVTETNFVPRDSRHQLLIDQQQSVRGARPLGTFHRQHHGFKGPVYILDTQKSYVSLQNEVVGVERPNSVRSFSMYPSQPSWNANFPERNPQDVPRDTQYPSTSFGMSNHIRSHYDDRFSRPDGGIQTMSSRHSKHTSRRISWPENDFNRTNTVFVVGFPMGGTVGNWLEKLFSECGDITNVNVLHEKYCAFIT